MRLLAVLAFAVGAGAVGGVVVPALVAGDPAAEVVTPAGGASVTLDGLAAPTPSPGERRAVDLLRKAAYAGQDLTYSGTQFVTSWSRTGTTSLVVDLQHVPGRGMWVRLAGGRGGHVAPAVVDDQVVGLDPRALSSMERHYALLVAADARCTGRTARVVEARRRGTNAVAGRFWLDAITGLLLRRELYDGSGRVVRAAAYVDLEMSAPRPWATATRAAAGSTGEPLDESQAAGLRLRGWVIPATLPGGLELYDARQRAATTGRVLQLSYSDGLFAVSIFAQRGRLDTRTVRGWTRTQTAGVPVYSGPGLSRRLVWSRAGTVYTVVADAPDTVVDKVVGSLRAGSRSDSFTRRVGRGLDRMGSWLNPLS